MTRCRIEVSGGFLFLAALLYYLDADGVVLWALLACALHELGHLTAIHLMGGGVTRLRLTAAGAELHLSAVRPLPPGRLFLAALAGPAVNLAAALFSARLARIGLEERFYLFAGLNLGLAVLNLLPVGWLDGGRALISLADLMGKPEAGHRLTEICAVGFAAALTFFGSLLLWQSGGRNFTLLITGLWMAGMAKQERKNGTF